MLSANGMNGRRKIRNLIDTWVRFGEFLKTSLGKEGVQKAQEEKFLRLKARIAHLLPILTVIEKGGTIDPEALTAVRDITGMLNSFTTLATPEPLTAEETEEIIARWHSIFIYLNRLEGALRERRYGFVGRGSGEVVEGGFARFSRSRLTRFLLSLIIIVAGVTLVAGLLDFSLEDARHALGKGLAVVLGTQQAPSEMGSSSPADSVSGATGEAVADAEATRSAGSGEVTSTRGTPGVAATESVVQRTIGVEKESVVPAALRPLVRQYGKHLTMIVFAIFLAGVVFLFFLRVK
jgi:hypothetical protein